ncbi:putative ribonuclease H-like domain-containing protein [Tanacetum coccineum]
MECFERDEQTLIEAARTMLADSLLPTTFWAEAVSTACYIFNRVLFRITNSDRFSNIYCFWRKKMRSRSSAYVVPSAKDNPKIQAFRRELEQIALKHLGTVPENNTTSTPSVNTSSQTVNTGRLDHDDSLMPELEIFTSMRQGFLLEAYYDEEG